MRERVAAAPDLAGAIHVLAAWFSEVHARTAALWRVVDEAAGHDGEIAAFARTRAHQRLKNYGGAAQQLAGRGEVAAGLGEEGLAALIWSVSHPQVYRTLVQEQGWSAERYQAFVEASLRAAVSPRR